jgi:hypothetical protein
MSLGGSYASGTDSFAASITNNTSTYGAQGSPSIAIGKLAKATSINSLAIGNACVSSAQNGCAVGQSSTASGFSSTALGNGANATNTCSLAIGADGDFNATTSSGAGAAAINGGIATGKNSYAFGYGSTSSQHGKHTVSSGRFSVTGDSQFGKIVLRAATTTTTAVVLTSDGAAASTTNQLIVATSQAMTFFGTLIAKQSASANMASYLIKGAIVNNAGTVSISIIAIETIVNTIGLTTQPTFTADNINKALTVTSGAKATTDIRWVCNLDSVEVTYA